jgi:hypothetical protein
MAQRDPTSPRPLSPIVSLDLGALLEQFRETAHQAAYEGTRQALAESAARASGDCWLGSAQAAERCSGIRHKRHSSKPAIETRS